MNGIQWLSTIYLLNEIHFKNRLLNYEAHSFLVTMLPNSFALLNCNYVTFTESHSFYFVALFTEWDSFTEWHSFSLLDSFSEYDLLSEHELFTESYSLSEGRNFILHYTKKVTNNNWAFGYQPEKTWGASEGSFLWVRELPPNTLTSKNFFYHIFITPHESYILYYI